MFTSFNAHSQLRVESNGHVGVGAGVTQNPFYIYSILGADNQVARTELLNPKTIAYVVKLRTTVPTPSVHEVVNDNFWITGDGEVNGHSMNYWSDSSLKNDIYTINDPLNKLLALRGVSYHWRPVYSSHTIDSFSHVPHLDSMSIDSAYTDSVQAVMDSSIVYDSTAIGDTALHYGFIAQEVQSSFPGHGMSKLLPNGINAIAYNEVIPLIVESVKAQQQQIANLNEESPNIASMGEQLAAQAALIASLQHKDSLRCTQIYNLNTTLSSHTSSISALNSNYTTLSGYVTTLQSTATTQAGQITGLLSDVSSLQSAVTALQSDSAYQAAQIASLQSALSALTTRTSTLETANTTKTSQIATLQTSVATLQSLIITLQNRLDVCCPEGE